MILAEGFSITDCVAKLTLNGRWRWPVEWLNSYPEPGQVPDISMSIEVSDIIKWRTRIDQDIFAKMRLKLLTLDLVNGNFNNTLCIIWNLPIQSKDEARAKIV
ncbi:hypothetical protein L2E82_22623 [Cichorium intybus]|uniref:Uncharacterized protein n=1 Tax=Cichorium intybus TaxID=13427 RepID=A0ACB9DYK4_CICIN|nr:hypothetical protein L2E82_22623 [Cichorium intybus]